VAFLYRDLYKRAQARKDIVWAVITRVTTRRTRWYNQLCAEWMG